MDTGQNPFQTWLLSAKEARGLSQAEIARMVGSRDVVVSRWLRGEFIPRLEQLRKIADAFGVDRAHLEQLAGRTDSALPHSETDTIDPEIAALVDTERQALQTQLEALRQEGIPRPFWLAVLEARHIAGRAAADNVRAVIDLARGSGGATSTPAGGATSTPVEPTRPTDSGGKKGPRGALPHRYLATASA